MNKPCLILILSLMGLNTQFASAEDCVTGASSAVIGPVSSLNIASVSVLGDATMVGAGLRCPSALLTLLTKNHIKYRAMNIPSHLKHDDGINTAGIQIWDTEKNLVSMAEKDLSKLSVLNLFAGTNKSIPFYITVNNVQSLKPGIYTGNFHIKWFYSVVTSIIGIGGISVNSESPGLILDKGLLGTSVKDWGTGADSMIQIRLIVEEDCKILAQNINFGTAPLISKFNPVTNTIQVTCSAQTPYNVGISDGLNFNTQRRMKHQSKNNFIAYEVFKENTSMRWGSLENERWSSAEASVNPGLYDGSVSQGYRYTAKVVEASDLAVVEGSYKDQLTIEVAF